jgi:hypothetical protein
MSFVANHCSFNILCILNQKCKYSPSCTPHSIWFRNTYMNSYIESSPFRYYSALLSEYTFLFLLPLLLLQCFMYLFKCFLASLSHPTGCVMIFNNIISVTIFLVFGNHTSQLVKIELLNFFKWLIFFYNAYVKHIKIRQRGWV